MKSKAQILEKLAESNAYVDSVLDSVGDRWETRVYDDGLQWTVRQVMIHVADADKGHTYQASNIAEGKEVIPADFDIERYNTRTTQKYAEKSIETVREELTAQRAAQIAWLEALDEEKLVRDGRHASGTVMTVGNILRMQALHAQAHAADIARVLGITL